MRWVSVNDTEWRQSVGPQSGLGKKNQYVCLKSVQLCFLAEWALEVQKAISWQSAQRHLESKTREATETYSSLLFIGFVLLLSYVAKQYFAANLLMLAMCATFWISLRNRCIRELKLQVLVQSFKQSKSASESLKGVLVMKTKYSTLDILRWCSDGKVTIDRENAF